MFATNARMKLFKIFVYSCQIVLLNNFLPRIHESGLKNIRAFVANYSCIRGKQNLKFNISAFLILYLCHYAATGSNEWHQAHRFFTFRELFWCYSELCKNAGCLSLLFYGSRFAFAYHTS